MTKFLAIGASLKAILITASFAFVRGDMLPVIVISVLFNLAHLSTKPFGQALQRDTIVIASDDPPRGSAEV
jgi:Na+/H+-dicarboxylate symporter